jgi:hypothetical protein
MTLLLLILGVAVNLALIITLWTGETGGGEALLALAAWSAGAGLFGSLVLHLLRP